MTFDEYLRRPRWMLDAACREHPELDFYPTAGATPVAVLAVCAACSVRAECLADALDRREVYGVWGGVGAQTRRRLGSVAA